MSSSNPNPDKIAANSNSKVIVLSMKNFGPTFKFDPTKTFIAAGNETTQPTVFSLKSQSVIQSTGAQKVQVVQQTAAGPVTKVGQAGTILIRAQQGASTSKFSPIAACPNVKIQEAPVKVQPANINKEISSSTPLTLTPFRNKVTNEITMKTQSGQTVLIQPSSKSQVAFASTVPAITAAPKPRSRSASKSEPAPPLQRISAGAYKMVPPVPIRPKALPFLAPHVAIPPLAKAQVMPNFHTQQKKWTSTNSQVYPGPVPALTLIQPKPQSVQIVEQEDSDSCDTPISLEYTSMGKKGASGDENSDSEGKVEDEYKLEFLPMYERTPPPKRTSQEERMLEVRRIIEGDLNDVQFMVVQSTAEKIPEETESGSVSDQVDSSSSMLLCDEKIETVSPNDSEKSKEVSVTPKATDDDSKGGEVSPAVQEIKKNLDHELSLECDKENVDYDDSISDASSMTESQRQKLIDYEESLDKPEITKKEAAPPPAVSTYSKPKRVRKPKNPTVISTMGLPYKAPGAPVRKTKVEKKLEFELDFHDPLNKIQWEDGIGGLNNCSKLFGFDEFGLIEVIDAKDAMAKLRLLDGGDADKSTEGGSFKLRKITDRADQFVCSVCAKFGTIRDFYTPECCSEACVAITKRKTGDYSAPVDRESESIDPVDERQLMYQGQMVPLQQLQYHLLEKQLPGDKRKRCPVRPVAPVPENKFTWDTYLTAKSIPAPVELFRNPYPSKPNPFKVGMKLEAIDPKNQKMICVCTVEEKLGYRIKLHFDGYPATFDFWANADSPNILPAGFCHSTNRVLQTPPKWSNKKFDWSEYLDYCNSIGAPRALFPRLAKPCEENPFEVGMKLETMRDGKLYAASIIDVIEDRVLICCDGHEELGCFWMDIFSPYLHPCNYHKTCEDPEGFIPPFRPFDWPAYLKSSEAKEAPAKFLYFRTRNPYKFEAGLKLEVVDQVNRQLIRPATVLCRDQYKIQVIFDGFDISFAYWLDDDSEDVHPINWCEKTGHPIEHPAGFSHDNGLCQSPGCRGVGNGVNAESYFHDIVGECPYTKTNWKKLLNQNVGSHLDAKNLVKRGRQAPNRNSGKGVNVKSEIEVEDDVSMDIEFQPAEAVAKKKVGRKRKQPTPAVEEEVKEVSFVEEAAPPAKRVSVLDSFLEDYGPQLNYSYELWKKNSQVLSGAELQGEFTENPLEWSVSKVGSFIKKISSDAKVVEKFTASEIDGQALTCLCQEDLTNLLGLKLGVAIKVYNRILHLRQEVMLKFFKI